MLSVHRSITIVLTMLACGALLLFGGESSLASRSNNSIKARTPTPGIRLAMNDPLTDNSQGNQWTESELCQFMNSAYYANVRDTNTIQSCLSTKQPFSDFAFVVQMVIVQGDCGGLAFRAPSDTDHGYVFEVCQDGTYTLYKATSTNFAKLTGGSSSAVHTGLKQTNIIGVEAKGNQLNFYINSIETPISRTSDNAFSQGLIGVIASSNNDPTAVAYTNARVITLSNSQTTEQ